VTAPKAGSKEGTFLQAMKSSLKRNQYFMPPFAAGMKTVKHRGNGRIPFLLVYFLRPPERV